MKFKHITNESKIIMYTHPEYRGATIPDEFRQGEVEELPVEQLYGFEPKAKLNAKDSKDMILNIAYDLKRGKGTEPVVVTKTDKGYMILDGHHRTEAYRMAQMQGIPAIVVDKRDITFVDAAPVVESSGYIPKEHEKNDPRFIMALTQDVRPGEIQRQANKFNMKVDKNGKPALLHKKAAKNTSPNKAYNIGLIESKLQSQLKNIKSGINKLVESELFEVDMSPGAVRKWVEGSGLAFRSGFEMEVYFPNMPPALGDDDPYAEADPDPEYNIEPRDLLQIWDHLKDAMSREIGEDAWQSAWANFEEQYYDWVYEQVDEEMTVEGFQDWAKENGVFDELIQEWRDMEAEDAYEVEFADLDDDQQQEIAEKAFESAMEALEEDFDSKDGQAYEDYKEYVQQGVLDDWRKPGEWIEERGWNTMKEVLEDGMDIWSWPYDWNLQGMGGDAEDAWGEVAEEIAEETGMEAMFGGSYHSTDRDPSMYILEDDPSLSDGKPEGFNGIEIVSPAQELFKTLDDIENLYKYLQQKGCQTSQKTGLHMGMSIDGEHENLDYAKLVLFLGDKHVLGEFGRGFNNYCSSAFEMMRTNVRSGRNFDPLSAFDALRKGALKLAGSMIRDNNYVGTNKYTSVHLKDGYIEFRSAGGEWLERGSKVLTDTMLRYARAYAIAVNPEAEKNEYYKKVYKLIAENSKDSGNSKIAELFARYQAGHINASKLKQEFMTTISDTYTNEKQATYHIIDKRSNKPVKKFTAFDQNDADTVFMNAMRGMAAQDPKHDSNNYTFVKAKTDRTDRRREFANKMANQMSAKEGWTKYSLTHKMLPGKEFTIVAKSDAQARDVATKAMLRLLNGKVKPEFIKTTPKEMDVVTDGVATAQDVQNFVKWYTNL